MRLLIGVILLGLASLSYGNPPSILNNSSHLVHDADATLTVLGIPHRTDIGPSATTLALNQTCPGCNNFVSAATAISWSQDISHVEYAVGSNAAVMPSVPYQIINQSSAGYTLVGYEQANYSALTSHGIVYSMAYCGTPQAGDYPPVAFVTVLPNTAPEMPAGRSGCGYAQGIEFSIPADNPGNCVVNNAATCRWTPIAGGGSVNVSSPSATTEAMSATLAALRLHHPQWTWGDVKSVLRTTASSWRSGYRKYNASGPAYGYGNINYEAANFYSGVVNLQPPGFSMNATDDDARFVLYPFLTSRRSGEVIYSFTQQPAFPDPQVTDEYTYAQIVSLVSAYDGTLIYNSNGASGIQSVSYTPPSKSQRYFVAFTVDNYSDLTSANFSRAESFVVQDTDFGAEKMRRIILQTIFD